MGYGYLGQQFTGYGILRGEGALPLMGPPKNDNVRVSLEGGTVKDEFQSVLRSLSTLMFINIISSESMECESMLFVTNHIPYL